MKKLLVVMAVLAVLVGYGWWESSKPIYMNIDEYGSHLQHSWTVVPLLALDEDGKYWSDEFILARSWVLFWKGPLYFKGRTNGYMEAPMKLERCRIIWMYNHPDEEVVETHGSWQRRTQVVATTEGCLEVPWGKHKGGYHLINEMADHSFKWRGKTMMTNDLESLRE